MRTAWVDISRACHNACVFCEARDRLDGRRVAPATVRGALDEAIRSGAKRIVLTGGEPTISPHLFQAITYVKTAGLQVEVTTNGRVVTDMEILGRLLAAGLDAIHVSIHGDDAPTHAALTGADEVAFQQATTCLALCAEHLPTTLRTVATARNADQIEALVTRAARVGAGFDLRAIRSLGAAAERPIDPDVGRAAWVRAHRACTEQGVPFDAWGFTSRSRLRGGVPVGGVRLDPTRRVQLRRGPRDVALLGGLRTPDPAVLTELADERTVPVADLPHLLAARGTPLLDLPPSHGGAGLDADDGLDDGVSGPEGLRSPWSEQLASPPPTAWRPLPDGARVRVLVMPNTPPLLALSSLPALVHVLRSRGIDAELRSPWSWPFDPEALVPERRGSLLGRVGSLLGRGRDDRPLSPMDDPERVSEGTGTFVQRLDLSDADVLVAPDLTSVVMARSAGLSRGAIVHVLDDGRLFGLDALLEAGGLGPRDVVRCAAPSTARAWSLAGVALAQLHWRPLPVHRPHLADVPRGGLAVFGHDALDLDLYQRVRDALPDAPWREVAKTSEGDHGSLLRAVTHLAGAAAAWAPWGARAASRAWTLDLSLLRAGAVPVVGADHPVLVDHRRPDDSLLVAEDTEAGHVAALRRWLDDASLRTRLTEAAADRADWADVDRFADELIAGAPPTRVVPLAPGRGPWWSWG